MCIFPIYILILLFMSIILCIHICDICTFLEDIRKKVFNIFNKYFTFRAMC